MNLFDKFSSVVKSPWFISLYVVLIGISYAYFDKPIAEFMYNQRWFMTAPWLQWVTFLAWGWLYVPGLLVLALVFKYILKNEYAFARTLFLWLCVIVPGVICDVLKIIVSRARPWLYLNKGMYGFQWFKTDSLYWSFPSGHTTVIMGLMFGLSVLFPRYLFIFLLVGLSIAATRIILFAHFLSDIMMATLLAFFVVDWLQRQITKDAWPMANFNRLTNNSLKQI